MVLKSSRSPKKTSTQSKKKVSRKASPKKTSTASKVKTASIVAGLLGTTLAIAKKTGFIDKVREALVKPQPSPQPTPQPSVGSSYYSGSPSGSMWSLKSTKAPMSSPVVGVPHLIQEQPLVESPMNSGSPMAPGSPIQMGGRKSRVHVSFVGPKKTVWLN